MSLYANKKAENRGLMRSTDNKSYDEIKQVKQNRDMEKKVTA